MLCEMSSSAWFDSEKKKSVENLNLYLPDLCCFQHIWQLKGLASKPINLDSIFFTDRSARTEDGQKGTGFGHRRCGTGGVNPRPPERLQADRVALAELSQGLNGCECDPVSQKRGETSEPGTGERRILFRPKHRNARFILQAFSA